MRFFVFLIFLLVFPGIAFASDVEDAVSQTLKIVEMKQDQIKNFCKTGSYKVVDKQLRDEFVGSDFSCKDMSGTLIIENGDKKEAYVDKFKFNKGLVSTVEKAGSKETFALTVENSLPKYIKYTNLGSGNTITIDLHGTDERKYTVRSIDCATLNEKLKSAGIKITNNELAGFLTDIIYNFNRQDSILMFSSVVIDPAYEDTLVPQIVSYIQSKKQL